MSTYKFVQTYKLNVDANKKAADMSIIILAFVPGFSIPAAILGAIFVLAPQKNAYLKIYMYYKGYHQHFAENIR